MRVCIVGAGAIGGFIGTRLAAAGQATVSAIARGATLAALQAHGWRLVEDGTLLQLPATAAADPRTLGTQDLVVIAVKGPALPALAPTLAPLLGPDTVVLPAMNGVPWWFGPVTPLLASAPLESADPGGFIARALPVPQVVGCVAHVSASTIEPGLVAHHVGRGLIVGEPAGGDSRRVQRIAALLRAAGFEVTCSQRIRHDVWYKLWGNMTANPVSALTGAPMDRVLDDELVREFCATAMREANVVGDRIGCGIDQTPADRHAITRRLGAFRTSMLQDADAGRPLELDARVGAVREIGQRVGVATPAIDAIFGLTRLFGRVRGLYPPA
jgi:2-dehydropantoate 2-reductase